MTNVTYQRCLDSFLSNEEDARAIEDAIKAAIKAVMYVLCNINDNKIREYELMVSQRDSENERLRMQVKSAERELISLRRHGRTMERGALVDSTCSVDSGISSEENSKFGLCVVPARCDGDEDILCQPVWSKELASPCARMADQVEHQGWGTMVDTSLVDLSKDFRCQSRGEWAQLKLNGEASQPVVLLHNAATSDLPVKEEPPDFETVRIKWEVCDHGVEENSGIRPVPKSAVVSTWPRDGEVTPPCGESQTHSFGFSVLPGERTVPPAARRKTRMSNREKLQRYRARIRMDPEKYQAYREMDRRRYQMRKKSIKDLPEQCQKLQREAWRQAARRHRARKKSCPPIGPHINLALNVEMPLDHTKILQNWK